MAIIVFVGLLWSLRADISEGVKESQKSHNLNILKDVVKNPALLYFYLLSMSVYLGGNCFAFMVPVFFGIATIMSVSSWQANIGQNQ